MVYFNDNNLNIYNYGFSDILRNLLFILISSLIYIDLGL